jgi:hypothetical protein
MKAQLAWIFDLSISTDPSNHKQFFNEKDQKDIYLDYVLTRECQNIGFPPSCDANLFFGFFFDGTNNNLKRDREKHSHSNVARLYEAFPGGADDNDSAPWPQLKEKYHNSFYRTYIPGVGTPFDEVKDSGQGFSLSEDRPKGLAFCYLGQNRIIWALVEAINNIHRYYKGSKLIDKKAFQDKFNHLQLPRFGDRYLTMSANMEGTSSVKHPSEIFTVAFDRALRDLHASLESYVPIGEGKLKDHGVVQNIFVSMFGFSRGAAEARAFANWFVWLCELDAKIAERSELSLGTIPVTIDFLGLFDTVASVGIAATAAIADGHQAWADAESSLRIPSQPKKCLHLVSAHEIRRSFPLDSVSYRDAIPDNCTEIVFPGVHSDIGGGYNPLEQGRGKDNEGADMISRITLAEMYRAARLAGVPLKLEEAPESVKRSFKVDLGAIEKFNAYIQYCYKFFKLPIGADGKPLTVPLHTLMAQQHQLYILWRKEMKGKMKDLPNVASPEVSHFDKTDIAESDKELEQEIRNFEAWRANPNPSPSPDTPTPPIFFNPEWKAINTYWMDLPPPAAVTEFLELFAHDSRAWFKPFGKDIPDLIHAMELLATQQEKEREWDATHGPSDHNPYRLTEEQRRRLLRYKRVRGTPAELSALEPDKKGREPIDHSIPFVIPGGYLRYRRIYMGSDNYKPAGAVYAGLMPVQHNSLENSLLARRRTHTESELA